MESSSGTQAETTEVPLRRARLIERALPEELILYDPDADRLFHLNRVSAAIWDLCDGRTSPDQMAEELAHSFDAPVSAILEDVRNTIARFDSDGMLEGLN